MAFQKICVATLAVLSIVFGGLCGLVCVKWVIGGILLFPHLNVATSFAFLGFVVSTLLVVVGIGLFLWREWARRLWLLMAAIGIFTLIVASVLLASVNRGDWRAKASLFVILAIPSVAIPVTGILLLARSRIKSEFH